MVTIMATGTCTVIVMCIVIDTLTVVVTAMVRVLSAAVQVFPVHVPLSCFASLPGGWGQC